MARLAWFTLLSSAVFVVSDAFVSPQPGWVRAPATALQGKRSLTAPTRTRFLTGLQATDEDNSAPVVESADEPAAPKTPVPEDLDYYSGLVGKQPGPEKVVEEKVVESAATTDYPINLPSYLLLCLATVASIAFTGCIFEATGSNPEIGYTATYIVGTLSLPTFIFLFYAAIKKGQAEVEEDDAKYGQGRR